MRSQAADAQSTDALGIGGAGGMARSTVRFVISLSASLLAVAAIAPHRRTQPRRSNRSRRTRSKPAPCRSQKGLGEIVATGYAQGPPSNEEFTIETAEGEIDTVEVSPSTTYIDRAVRIPKLSNISVGDYITVWGTISGPLATATT